MAGPPGLARPFRRSAQTGGDHLGPYLLRVVWPLAALSGLFLGLRVYCKLRRRRQLWWDDHVLVASWVRFPCHPAFPGFRNGCGPSNQRLLKITLVVSVALQSVGVHYGLGMSYTDLYEQGTISAVSKYSYIGGFFPILATCWSKTSVAISLLRLATGREMRWSIWFIIVIVNLVLGSNGLIQWVQCWPIRKLWVWELEGSCLPASVIQDYNTFIAGEFWGVSGVAGGATG